MWIRSAEAVAIIFLITLAANTVEIVLRDNHERPFDDKCAENRTTYDIPFAPTLVTCDWSPRAAFMGAFEANFTEDDNEWRVTRNLSLQSRFETALNNWLKFIIVTQNRIFAHMLSVLLTDAAYCASVYFCEMVGWLRYESVAVAAAT